MRSEAIQLLQQHERLRQGRLRAVFMKSFQEQEAKRQALIAKGVPDLTQDQAAVRIQSGWRGHKARQLTARFLTYTLIQRLAYIVIDVESVLRSR